MFEVYYGIDNSMAILTFIFWWIAAARTSNLALLPTEDKMRRVARINMRFVYIGMALALFRAVWQLPLGLKFGWPFTLEKILLASPLILTPVVFVMLISIPRQKRIANERSSDTAPIKRRDAADPALVVPIQAAACGAAAGLYILLFPQTPPYIDIGLSLSALMAAAMPVLWYWQRWRARRLGSIELPMLPSIARRATRKAAVFVILGIGIGLLILFAKEQSKLPEQMSMTDHSNIDYGGGPALSHGGQGHHQHSAAGESVKTVSVVDLKGPQDEAPDKKFALTAEKTTVRLSSGKTIEAWTYNGQIPGPELRVTEGDLVEVTLLNKDIEAGVTIHWHGLDVPNGEDGVAGLTQDSVMPGESYTYRFRVNELGTHWYHSHQASSVQVKKGLFGALVIMPKDKANGVYNMAKSGGAGSGIQDIVLIGHTWEFSRGHVASIGLADNLERRKIAPGTAVRLRFVNASSEPETFELSGTRFQVAAIDGAEVNEPGELENVSLHIASGGRNDVIFTMPNTPVALRSKSNREAVILISADGSGEIPPWPKGKTVFNPASYGNPLPMKIGLDSDFDREFKITIDVQNFAFYNGKFATQVFRINGKLFPETPMQMVRKGDLIKITIINRSYEDHPIHPHGHHMQVLSRNGKSVTGSPWIVDTLNVGPGETYEVAIRADNPGIWMNHCHNLEHAAVGMILHLAYEGVTSPFLVGEGSRNLPE
ncbi:multicopper oxidase family protein [Cohnella silvisoli]|uniref:Multicopper oxidase family protein n=1 Tax=Cohnella silvisoli TaxID=2873699 RepID=A0ABV1KQZ6_9BACL|nr:multicopper oxidase family protein [Cohnella silvisoli]MCD9024638.1 multicopper oxidase family protein [Cohnella silvisoli]